MISRRRRTEVLVEGDPTLARDLAALVEREAPAREVVAPHQGLVMCQVRETARNTRFYLGEALMTECRVRLGEAEGLGVVLGSDASLARSLAVVDAALAPGSGVGELAGQIERSILVAERELDRRRARQAARTLASRVSFDEMGGQDMSVQAVVR